MTARKVTRCNNCRDTDGWILDPETLLPVRRCPCAEIVQTAQQARAAALASVDWSKPKQRAAAYRIIDLAAQQEQYLDADTVRDRMDIAQIDASARTAAFRQAVAEGLLEPDGEVPSTHPPTHGKKIVRYRSRSFSRQLGTG